MCCGSGNRNLGVTPCNQPLVGRSPFTGCTTSTGLVVGNLQLSTKPCRWELLLAAAATQPSIHQLQLTCESASLACQAIMHERCPAPWHGQSTADNKKAACLNRCKCCTLVQRLRALIIIIIIMLPNQAIASTPHWLNVSEH
jgi:hypothetical protein